MSPKLAILGGGSPFTLALFDAILRVANDGVPHRVSLYGRDPASLELVRGYGSRRLSPHGWQIEGTTALAEALVGAGVVLHQIRYGGLALRAAGEQLCARLGMVADETLGPAALLTVLSSLDELRRTCEALRRYAPDAWVVNVTNPLSAVTATMAGWGISKCIGTCELPTITAGELSRVLGVPPDELDWNYQGFNHRGFLYNLRRGTVPLLPTLLMDHGGERIGGLPVHSFGALQGVPLKYFRLWSGEPDDPKPRAAFLTHLRERILRELVDDPSRPPPSLHERPMAWYRWAIVPLIMALNTTAPSVLVLTTVDQRGLAIETPAWTDRQGARRIPQPPPPPPVADWMRRFEVHERTLMNTLRAVSLEALSEVVACDPVCIGTHPRIVASAVWQAWKRTADAADVSR